MAWTKVCTLTDTSGVVYIYEIDTRTMNNTRWYYGRKTTEPGRTSNSSFKYPSGAIIEDGDTFWLFISAAYNTYSNLIRRTRKGTSEVIYASYEMYHQWPKASRVEFEDLIPFFKTVSSYSNWSYYRTYDYKIYNDWLGGKFPSNSGEYEGIKELNESKFSYPKHPIGGDYQEIPVEDIDKEIKIIDESRYGSIAVVNYPEMIKPIALNFATVYCGTALIRTMPFEDIDWNDYSSKMLYGKIGAEPACDNTDDVVLNVASTLMNKFEVENLTEETTYYFCLELTKASDSTKYKSNALRVYIPHTKIDRWKNVDTTGDTIHAVQATKLDDTYVAENGGEDGMYFGSEYGFSIDDPSLIVQQGIPINLQTYIDIGKALPPNGSCTETIFSNGKFQIKIDIWNDQPDNLTFYYYINNRTYGEICEHNYSADYYLDGENMTKHFMLVENEKCDYFGEESVAACATVTNYNDTDLSYWDNYSSMYPDKLYKYIHGAR